MMHAQIIDGTIANLRPTPAGGAWGSPSCLLTQPSGISSMEGPLRKLQ